ncbi:MAG TPA: nuclear transport factor 2 family protein [Pyrinomonadaceae bacterium]|nr:nuclear transport factor 2 family protein [Pyrinomonadaceae bacterium]
MKKLVLFVFVLIAVSACAPPTNQSVNTNTASPSPTATPLTEAEAIAKERALWDALKAKDHVAFEKLLSTDYIEVLPDGVNDRAGTLTEVKDLEISDVTFSDWRMIPLGNDAALLIYNATIKGKFKGEAFPEGPYRNASGWVNRDGNLQVFYYQETLTKPAPTASASPVVSPTVTASPSATPSASAALATLPADPVEREKLIWDTLKRKDFDAFASYLDPAQVEVEPEGVFDKAGTLQAVRRFDASTAQLSDFKTIKVNATTELVSYLVTMPGPVEDHLATTIWVNRGGKWQAIFHQGTTLIAVAPRPSPATSPSASPSASAPATPAK